MTVPTHPFLTERSDRPIADEIRMAAHELQGPLVQAEAYALLVHDRLDPDENGDSRLDLEILAGALAQARAVVDALLHDAVLPPRPVARRPVDLATVAVECVEHLQAEIQARESTVRIAHLPVVGGDEALLAAVLRNLVANALRHGKPRGGRIELSAERDGARWRISVASDGPAIPEAESAELFLPYRRGRAGQSARGAGLGLAVCSRLLERLGGTIGVSGAGGRNVFVFTLPV